MEISRKEMLRLSALGATGIVLDSCGKSVPGLNGTQSYAPQIVRPRANTLINMLDRYILQYCSAAPVITVALYADGTSILRGYAQGKPSSSINTDWVLGIGSNTKVFTSTLLAYQCVAPTPKLKLRDRVIHYLPPIVKKRGDAIKQVRLVDLATHTASFPHSVPFSGSEAFTDQPPTHQQIHWWIHWKNAGPPHTSDACAGQPPGTCWQYSDWGFITLANAVTRYNSIPSMVYTKQLRDVITERLGMQKTGPLEKLSVPGYNSQGHVETHLPTDLRSTAKDMLNWLTACLGRFPGVNGQLNHAITLTMQTHWSGTINNKESSMGLGWQLPHPLPGEPQVVWKNGGGSGYYSFMGLVPSETLGIAILTNSQAANPTGCGLALLRRLAAVY